MLSSPSSSPTTLKSYQEPFGLKFLLGGRTMVKKIASRFRTPQKFPRSSLNPKLAPIQMLPVEILLMIFLELTTLTGDSTPCLVLKDVCKHWKNVVENFSSLWTIIMVPQFRIDMDDKAIERQVNHLSLALSLSSRLPLIIKSDHRRREVIDQREDLSNEARLTLSKRYAECMLSTLVSEQDRWTEVDIVFDHALFLHFNLLRQQFRSAAGTLTGIGKNIQKWLLVRLNGGHWESKSLRDLFSWLREPVTLEMLAVEDYTADFILRDIAPDLKAFSGIPCVIFRRESLTFEDCVKVMLHCSTSREIHIFSDKLAIEQLDTTDISRIHNALHGPERTTLEAQNVVLIRVQSPFNFLNGFTMSNLVELTITDCTFQENPVLGDPKVLADFLHRSQCSLTRLAIVTWLEETQALSLLREPALKKIREVEIGVVATARLVDTGDSQDVDVYGSEQSLRLLQGMNFKIWRKVVEMDVTPAYYHYGWKEFTSEEVLVVICEDGKITQC